MRTRLFAASQLRRWWNGVVTRPSSVPIPLVGSRTVSDSTGRRQAS